MPLELLLRPALVQVRDADGEVRPALLLARRGARSYLQVSRGAGDNVLRWLPSAHVLAPWGSPGEARGGGAAVEGGVAVGGGVAVEGWAAVEVRPAPVQLRQPRSWR